MGAAVESASEWPLHAVYPTLDELAVYLGRELQPFVLLMEPGDDYGFLRRWQPVEIGPGRHYAYAFQWFAMAVVLAETGIAAFMYALPRFKEGEFGGTFSGPLMQEVRAVRGWSYGAYASLGRARFPERLPLWKGSRLFLVKSSSEDRFSRHAASWGTFGARRQLD